MKKVGIIFEHNGTQRQVLFEKHETNPAIWKNATILVEEGEIPMRVFAKTLDEGLQKISDKLDEWGM